MKPRTVVIITLSVLSLPVVLIGGCTATLGFILYRSCEPVAASANGFLENIRSGNMQEAYGATAVSVRNKVNRAQFEAEVKAMKLTEVQDTTWTRFQIQNHQARLEGSATMATGERSSIAVTLVRTQDSWKIESVVLGANGQRKSPPGGGNKASTT